MSGTLAYNMRPQSLLDILGQKHIIGENGLFTKFVEKNHPMSVILYGPPGCGKTTLAMALAHDLNMPCRTFNASTGNKKEMDLIIEEAKLSNGLFVIIDEIHRMNKMKQDNLLPYVESGLLIIVGCTTANPYHSINPAIRSRCQIIEVKPLTQEDIIQGLHHALDSEKGYHHQYQCDEEVLQHIARLSSGDIRFAYNCLEVCTIISHDNHITIEDAKNALTQANGQFDKDEDQYYDTLSGLQKSIRGSDPNGAMYYFAKLIEYNDIESLERRVLVCASTSSRSWPARTAASAAAASPPPATSARLSAPRPSSRQTKPAPCASHSRTPTWAMSTTPCSRAAPTSCCTSTTRPTASTADPPQGQAGETPSDPKRAWKDPSMHVFSFCCHAAQHRQR